MAKKKDDTNIPLISRDEFDSANKEDAISVFSRCHLALFNYLLIGNILYTLVIFVLALLYGEAAIDIAYHPVFLPLSQIVVMYFIAFPIFCIKVRNIPKASREKNKIGFGEFFSLLLIGLALMEIGKYLSLYTSAKLYSIFTPLSNIRAGYSYLSVLDTAPTILFVVILAPIFEELIFRKLLIDRFSVYGDRLAVIVTSVAFGLFHGNITQLFFAILAGFVLGHVYTKTRNVMYSIALHMMINLFGTIPGTPLFFDENIASNFVEEFNFVASGSAPLDTILSFVKTATIILGLVLLVFSLFNKKYRLSRECDIEIPKMKLLRVVVLNKGTILFTLWCVLTIIELLFLSI